MVRMSSRAAAPVIAVVLALLALTPQRAAPRIAQPPTDTRADDGRSATHMPGCATQRDRIAALLGRSEAEVRAELAKHGGITTIRSGAPGMKATRDYRPDRATLVIESGDVTSIVCG